MLRAHTILHIAVMKQSRSALKKMLGLSMLLLCLLAPITSPVTSHLSWLVPLLGLVPSSLAISLFQLKFISLLTAHASLAYLVLPPSEVCLNELWTTITMETTYIQFFLLSLLCASWSLRLRCVEHRDFCCWDLANTWKYLVCHKVIAWSNTGRFLCGKFLLLQMTRELKKNIDKGQYKASGCLYYYITG